MKRRRTGLGLTVITVLLLFAVISVKKVGLDNKDRALKEELARYEQELSDTQNEKQDIEEYGRYVQSDEYKEDVARNKLGLVYPDEIVFEPEDGE